jgi:hypothetical protein
VTGVTWRPGDRARTLCDDLRGDRVTAVVQVEKVTRLGCGCDRLSVRRPGVPGPDQYDRMHLVANRCEWHARHEEPATPEPCDGTE